MKFGFLFKYALVPLLILLAALFYKKFPSVKQDNAVEEFVEKVIEEKTELAIDLSPGSPEK